MAHGGDPIYQNVHCSFENVFTASIGETVGDNIHKILGIKHFKINEMAAAAPSPYSFICGRREANQLRDRLWEITTDTYSHIWFSMQDEPFHALYDQNPVKIKEYPAYFYFGSMYLHDTFNIHSERYPTMHDLRITKLKEEPETIRIMSRDKSRQISIPIKWIQHQVLVNTKKRPFVVLMLKYSVIMKRKIPNNGQSTYERICETGDSEFETIVSKSSDILLSFNDIQHTWVFLKELTSSRNERHTKFKINFVTLRQDLVENDKQPFCLPSTASNKQQYALKMLYSMGYVFQDKYSKQIHNRLVTFDQELFNNVCYYLKDKLVEDHCYNLQCVFDVFNGDTEKKSPEEQSLEKKYSIGSVSLTPLRILFQKRESSMGNRVLRMQEFNDEDMFLLVHIREEDNQELKNFDSSIKRRLASAMLHGLKTMGRTYRLFGASNSQLREMSFWFMASDNRSIEDAWKVLGDFSAIKNVASFIARIGLYFTTSRDTKVTFQYEKNFSPNMTYVATMIDDIETKDEKYCFTDGIGKMSWGIAGLVAIKLNMKLKFRDNIPSAYQVRIAGCKGMLAIDPESTLNDYYIKIRPSMKKFESDNWNLEICEYSKPLGLKLNNQVIMLLSDLGNSDAIFQSYQNIALANLATDKNDLIRKVEYSSAKDDLLKNKIPLPLNEARNMFGIVDETGTLEYGQVFIQYKSLDGQNHDTYIIVTGDVLVAKMPCLYPGDFRKFTAVDVPQLQACIRDCIVFPIKGPRPHPNEMSGSDLDGDKYWVYWGDQLKIRRMDEPLSYEPSKKQTVERITNEIVIDHIVESFGTGAQGIICDVHLAIADCHPQHTRSPECIYLAELFARAVDAPKTGEVITLDKVNQLRTTYCQEYPQFMKKYDQPTRVSSSILNKLFLRAVDHLNNKRIPHYSKYFAQQIRRTSMKDDEFDKWLKFHGYCNENQPVVPITPPIHPWPGVGETVAGGNGPGEGNHQLLKPEGLFIDDDQTMIIADTQNHRIVQWRMGAKNGQVVAGGNGKGAQLNQLNNPTDMLIDKETNSFIITDWGNHRLVRWSRLSGTSEGEILLNNIQCSGLAMDDQKYLYICDTSKKEVRRYHMDQIGRDQHGTLVAGSTRNGIGLDRLKWPTFLFVDQQQAVYVSDSSNNRVMKWDKDALEGTVVAGDQTKGNARNQLSYPQGIVIDKTGTLYVADQWNNRVMRWPIGATEGTVVAGTEKHGKEANQLNQPRGLSFDQDGHLYVVDSHNHRVQRFYMEQNELIAMTNLSDLSLN